MPDFSPPMSMPVSLAEAERREERGDAVDAERVGEAVEVDVAGARDGIVEVHVAVLLVVVLAEHARAAGQVEGAGAVLVRLRIHHVIGEAGERDAPA